MNMLSLSKTPHALADGLMLVFQHPAKVRVDGRIERPRHMLTNTFIHIQGIGVKTEQKLWGSGLTDWSCLSPGPIGGRPSRLNGFFIAGIEDSIKNLDENNPAYFGKRLPASQSWRLFPEFRSSTAYIDIETTGLDRDHDEITTIALYDGASINTYVQGRNLDQFVDDIQDYRVLVTYNGRCFDVPFMERYFKTRFTHAQIDLRYILNSMGFKGGLKGCERRLGMDRGDLAGVDGFLAVHLWDRYKRKGDLKALESLLAYNVQDTINLEHLLVTSYNMKAGQTPFAGERQIPEVVLPENPFGVDVRMIEEIQRSFLRGPW
jgi:uncharacterized protein